MFISLEGVDGSGKSTQARLLVEALGAETVAIREPGGTDAAERIRELLADPALELDPLAELLLFLAARADLIERVIRPAWRPAATSSPTASPTPASPTRGPPAGSGSAR